MSFQIQQSTARTNGRCITWACCGVDEPLANYTSDHSEARGFVAEVFDDGKPDIDEKWERKGCLKWCYSNVSQADADLCALTQICVDIPDVPGGPDWCLSDPQSCSATCEYGGEFTASIPGGQILADGCDEANVRALSLCQSVADAQTICLTGSLPNGCFWKPYFNALTLAGNGVPATVAIVPATNLPIGLTVSLLGMSVVFSGTPLEWGEFTFDVVVTTTVGTTTTRRVSLCLVRIINPDTLSTPTPSNPNVTSSLADATVDSHYKVQMEAAGCTGRYKWTLYSGTLPTGMTITEPGVIEGTPTIVGDYDFVIQVEDDVTANAPPPAPIPYQPAGLIASFITSPESAYLPGTVQFLNNSTGTGTLFYIWNFGDGTTSALRNPTHVYDDDGTKPHLVTLTVGDGHIIDTYTAYVGSQTNLKIKAFDVDDWPAGGSNDPSLQLPVIGAEFDSVMYGRGRMVTDFTQYPQIVGNTVYYDYVWDGTGCNGVLRSCKWKVVKWTYDLPAPVIGYDANPGWYLFFYTKIQQTTTGLLSNWYTIYDYELYQSFVLKMKAHSDVLSDHIYDTYLSSGTKTKLANYDPLSTDPAKSGTAVYNDLVANLTADINTNIIFQGTNWYDATAFASVALSAATIALLITTPTGIPCRPLNRMLLEDGYPSDISRNHSINGVYAAQWSGYKAFIVDADDDMPTGIYTDIGIDPMYDTSGNLIAGPATVELEYVT